MCLNCNKVETLYFMMTTFLQFILHTFIATLKQAWSKSKQELKCLKNSCKILGTSTRQKNEYQIWATWSMHTAAKKLWLLKNSDYFFLCVYVCHGRSCRLGRGSRLWIKLHPLAVSQTRLVPKESLKTK